MPYEKAPSSGAFLPLSLMYFLSGEPMHDLSGVDTAAWTENIGSPTLKLSLPRRDLIGVNVELFRKLNQRSIALDGGKRHLSLEGRCVVPTGSSCHGLS